MVSSTVTALLTLALLGQGAMASLLKPRAVVTITPSGTTASLALCTPWPTAAPVETDPIRCVAKYWVGPHKPSPEDCSKCEVCIVDNEWVGYCRSVGYIQPGTA